MFHLRREEPDDRWEVEALFDLCFAPGRMALSSYRLRDGVPPMRDLCLVAHDSDEILAGAVRFWPVRVGQGADALLLGPIAVHPTRQGEGLGARLVQTGLKAACAADWNRVLLVGDAPYYGRFGFRRLNTVRMPPPTSPDRVLGHGAWNGVSGTVMPWRHQA
ncbi:MAG: N-acetyltransferase [Rhodobacteraceae bacterium]|nr:N-acetyltransferase [Paracoccaceae bacterium]